jgi:hypothetical protein
MPNANYRVPNARPTPKTGAQRPPNARPTAAQRPPNGGATYPPYPPYVGRALGGAPRNEINAPVLEITQRWATGHIAKWIVHHTRIGGGTKIIRPAKSHD